MGVPQTCIPAFPDFRLSDPQQAQLREALRQTPGQILLYINPMSRLQPVQALTSDTWRRCLDPAQARADACG